jgi:hypothetical protein
MTHIQIIEWLEVNRPNCQWSLSGNGYEGLVWLSSPETKPTAQEIGL